MAIMQKQLYRYSYFSKKRNALPIFVHFPKRKSLIDWMDELIPQ
jgi:hypothetical protein